jgi:hypothetical protein
LVKHDASGEFRKLLVWIESGYMCVHLIKHMGHAITQKPARNMRVNDMAMIGTSGNEQFYIQTKTNTYRLSVLQTAEKKCLRIPKMFRQFVKRRLNVCSVASTHKDSFSICS